MCTCWPIVNRIFFGILGGLLAGQSSIVIGYGVVKVWVVVMMWSRICSGVVQCCVW